MSESDERIDSLALAIRGSFNSMMLGVHTMIPGVIDSFDGKRAKVVLSIAGETVDGVKHSHPALINVPVQFPRFGGFSLTMPVKRGDEVAVFFSERSMDTWLQEGKVDSVPQSVRYFDMSDAFAVSGLTSDDNTITPHGSAMELKSDNGNTTIRIWGSGGVEILNSSGEVIDTMKAVVDQLAIETVTVTGGSSAGTYPIDGQAVYTPLANILNSFITGRS